MVDYLLGHLERICFNIKGLNQMLRLSGPMMLLALTGSKYQKC